MTARRYETSNGSIEAWKVDRYDEENAKAICQWVQENSNWKAYYQVSGTIENTYHISIFKEVWKTTLLAHGEFVIKDSNGEIYPCEENLFNLLVIPSGSGSVCVQCEGAGWNMVPDPRDPSGQTPMQEQCDCSEITENLKAKAERLITSLEDELCGFQQTNGACAPAHALANTIRELINANEKEADFRSSGYGEGYAAGWNHLLNSNLRIVIEKLEVEVERLAKF